MLGVPFGLAVEARQCRSWPLYNPCQPARTATEGSDQTTRREMAQQGLHPCLAKISWKVRGCKEQEDTSLQSHHEGLVRKDRQTQPRNGSNNEDREALASSICRASLRA